MQFLLNHTLIEASGLPPDLTVLDYLREHQRLTGTKEGCASGDCGACTVVVASVHLGRLEYQSINSCITLLGDLHGKQLITVEHLAQDGDLHCVQRAMVDHHGSQCGFCTPGFVMSIFALTKNATPADGADKAKCIDRTIGGNLCRCTGYRPIKDAASQALTWALADGCDTFSEREAQVVSKLNNIAEDAGNTSEHFFRPESLKSLFTLMADYPDATLVAGCTDFSLEITQRLNRYPQLISVKRVAELNYATCEQGMWRLGAGLSIEHLRAVLGPVNASINVMLLRYGSTQVRNRATVGGNIGNASPIGDLPPLFLALRADIVLRSANAERVLSLHDFFINYKQTALAVGEIISELRFDASALDDAATFRIYKVSKRIDDDISAVCAAFNQTDGNLTAAFGGMAAIPKRAAALESAANDAGVLSVETAVLTAQALETDFQPISDARASADYRIAVAKNLYKRFVLEVTQPESAYMLQAND